MSNLNSFGEPLTAKAVLRGKLATACGSLKGERAQLAQRQAEVVECAVRCKTLEDFVRDIEAALAKLEE